MSKLADDFTIQVTQYIDDEDDILFSNFLVGKIKDNSFKVYGKNGKFYWTLFGKRESIKTEPRKCDVTLKGDGPYRYIY